MGCLHCFSGVKSFHVKIILLDKQELIQEAQESTTGQQLLDNIFTYLNLIETAYFGLRYQDNGNQTVIIGIYQCRKANKEFIHTYLQFDFQSLINFSIF